MDATHTLASLQPQLLGHFSGLMLNVWVLLSGLILNVVFTSPKKKLWSETECFTCSSKPRFRLPYCLIVHWPASWILKSWCLMFEVPFCSGVEVMEGSGSPLPIGVFVNFSFCFLLGTKCFHLARNGWILFLDASMHSRWKSTRLHKCKLGHLKLVSFFHHSWRKEFPSCLIQDMLSHLRPFESLVW